MTAILTRSLFLTSPMMRGGDVSAVQAVLRHTDATLAIDGVFGRATDAAVRGFQRNTGLSRVDGIVGPESWGRMFGTSGSGPGTTAALAPVHSGADADAPRTCFELLVQDGWTPQQACGILGNIQRESGFLIAARGDGGSAYGLAQWHPPRQLAFAKRFNRPIQGSSLADQTHFITFEMTDGEMAGAGHLLRQETTPEGSADTVCRKYEIPADPDGESRKRSQFARAFFDAFTANPPAMPPPVEPREPATANVVGPSTILDMMDPHGAFPGGTQWALKPYGIQVNGKDLPVDAATVARLDGLWNKYAARLPTTVRVPAELALALMDLFKDRTGTAHFLPGCDTLMPERTPDLVTVGPLQVSLAAARTALARPDLTVAQLSDGDLALQAGMQALSLRFAETRFDPPLVAAAHLAGGLFFDGDTRNPWRLAQGGPTVLIDKFLASFNTAMQVTGSRSPPAGLTSMHELLESISAPSALPSVGPYRAVDPDFWDRKPAVGDHQCVALVQVAAHAPHTKLWKQGDNVQQHPPERGTAIATFQNGIYQNDMHGLSHAALFLELVADGLSVIDQWETPGDPHPPQKRTIPFVHPPGPKNTPANRGSAFSVIL
jgi:Phage tail lysozyme/Putative peptidoglycan binding domain